MRWEQLRAYCLSLPGATETFPFESTVSLSKAAHLNQKPLDLMRLIIEASSEPGDVVWEPFGGLFSACLAAKHSDRRAFGAEIDHSYFQLAVAERFSGEGRLFT